MQDPVLNFAKVTVSTGYDASATSIVLVGGDGARLPQPSTAGAFNLVWWNSTDYGDPADDPSVEIIRVTARSTDTLTVTRAQESTSASTKNTASKTYKMILTLTKLNADLLGTPAGSNKDIQFNDSSVFGGDGLLTYDKTTNTLNVGGAAPSLTLTDITASAKSLIVAVDANLARFRESAGAAGSLLVLDLANNRVGIGTMSPTVSLQVAGAVLFKNTADSTAAFKVQNAAGTINALVVDTTNNRVGIGYVPSSYKLEIHGNDAIGQIKRYNESGSAFGPGFLFTRTRGTSPATATDIVAGDSLGKLQFQGMVTTDKTYGYLSFIASDTSQNGYFSFQDKDANDKVVITTAGNVGIGTTNPTAFLHIKAGVATANAGAPIKLTSGTDLTTAEAGAIEYDGTNFHITHSDAVRNTIVSTIGLTNTRIPYCITTNSELGDSANLTFDGTSLSCLGTVASAGFKIGATAGIDATIPIAPVTPLTIAGSAVFTKGILTSYTAPS